MLKGILTPKHNHHLILMFITAIYGVGKAAVHLPALAILSHRPEKAEKNIAWVGKGIVYDTGGLCLKTRVCHDSEEFFLEKKKIIQY